MAEKSTLIAILCGGKGARLRPLSDQYPKAMAPINGQPMLDHILDFFEAKGYDDFMLCVGYKADVIIEHFANQSKDRQLKFSNEGESASMLKRINALRDEEFESLVIIYGDTFIDLDIDELLRQHVSKDAMLTLVTAEMRNPLGEVTYEKDGWVQTFREKPIQKYYIGCMVLKRQAFDMITPEMIDQPDGNGLVHLFNTLIETNMVAAYQHDGVQVSYNTVSEFDNAQEVMYNFYTYNE